MKRTNGKQLIRVFSLVFSIILLFPAFAACKEKEGAISSPNNEEINMIEETPFGYTPVLAATRLIQMGKGCIYFSGKEFGIFKYDIETGEISEICTDPLCAHAGKDDTCCIGRYTQMMYFRAFSNVLIYNAFLGNEGKVTNHLLAYSPSEMKNVILDTNAASNNLYVMSDKYAYYTNLTVKDGVDYFNYKQVSLSDGSVKIFGEETEGDRPYILVGAYGGYIYAHNKEQTATYICSEDDPGNFKLFWEKPISYIWAGEDDLFFRSHDPENDDGKRYFYHTDREGNVLEKHEIVGDMRWCSFYDGRYLYYIPADTDTFVNIDEDETVTEIHWREIYCLDMRTGEREVAFTFNGDYETMALQLSLGNDMIVHDGKIYTYRITEQKGYMDKEADKWISKEGAVSFADGICIIDMKTGDVTHITANYKRLGINMNEFVCETKTVSMRLEGEPETEETTVSAETDAPETPEVIVLDKSLMFNDTDALPLFRAKDLVSKTPNRYEVYDAKGEKINLCYCGATPCTCGNNDRLVVCGSMIYTMGESGGGKTVFHAYDASDRNNIRHSSVTVEGFDTETHNILRSGNRSEPYFYIRPKEGNVTLSILDMTDAINGNVKVRDYPSLVGTKYSIRITTDSAVYLTMTDENENVKVIKAEAGKAAYTELFEIKLESESASGYNLLLDSDGALHCLREEIDDQSKYGYSLYQYTYREGKAVERVLRAKNVCDFIVLGEYFYYTVNNPANSRKFLDQDSGKRTYNDMTGGIIFRNSIEDTSAPREAVWSVGDYYLYGFTPKNRPKISSTDRFTTTDMGIFIISPEGGIAIQANKMADGKMLHVYLLIGNTDEGVIMTEILGADWWGVHICEDFGRTGSVPNNQTNPYEVIEDEG